MLLQVALTGHVAASREHVGSSSNVRLMLLQRMLLMLVTQQNDDVSQEGKSGCWLSQWAPVQVTQCHLNVATPRTTVQGSWHVCLHDEGLVC